MLHTDKFFKTEEMMLYVIGCVEQYSETRFIASLYTRNYTKIDIHIAINDVRRCLMLVHGELLRLSKYSLEFLDLWATRDNQRFTTAEKMFNRLRSSMAYLKHQYRKSTRIVYGTPAHNPLLMPSVFQESVLTYGDCPRDLFKIESYNDEVQTLYIEQRALFGNILAALNLCYGVIKAEKEIGNSLEECEKRFDRQLEEITNMLQDYMGQFQSNDGGIIRQQIERFGKNAFKDNQEITSVTIADGITAIGDNAFDGCVGLVVINIGKDVQSIGNKAFANIGSSSGARTRSELSSIVVNCYAEKVPQTATDAFENTQIETGSLFVDDNLKDSFKTTSPWSRFGKIIGFKESTGLNAVKSGSGDAMIFDIQGNRLDKVRKGVNIIRTRDGKTKKIVMK